jgi:hypothetical protein
MIHDANIEVSCDGDCGDYLQISPEYKYSSYSGEGGHYDCSDEAISEKVEKEGWTVDGDKQYCEACSQQQED